MPIKQLTYYIPPNLEIGIMSGIYKRFGGVVRNAKTGEIVKHLNEVGEPTKKAGSAVMQAIKKHPVATIGIGVVATATTATISYFVKKKKEKEYKTNSPKCIIKFDTSLQKYIRAVRKGTLDEKIIDNLMKSLDRIMEDENGEKIVVELSKTELKQLVDIVYDYTKKLAKNNFVELEKFRQSSPNLINNLHNYLEVQKQIFKEVA
jgi:uncharacterized protein (DUF697 family)